MLQGVDMKHRVDLTTIPTQDLAKAIAERSEWMVMVCKEPIGDPITVHKGHPVWLQGILVDMSQQIHQSARKETV